MNLRMGVAEWSMLLALSILWGGSFYFVEIALTALPPFTVVAGRVALAAVLLWLVVFLRGARVPRSPGVWLSFVVMGLINNVLPFSLIVWGQTAITAGVASILNATAPLFGVVLAVFFLPDEPAGRRRVLATVLGFVGVAVMLAPDAARGLGSGVLGQLAVLAASLSYAVAGVFGRRFAAGGIAPLVSAAGQVSASALIMIPLSLLVDRPLALPAPGAAVLASIVALAALSTAVAYILYFRILERSGAMNLLLVTFLIPVWGILLGVLLLGERLAGVHVAGMLLIGSALLIMDGRILAMRRRGARSS